MAGPYALLMENRGLLAISGPDTRAFLQGLISNDIERVGPVRAVYAALLTPQGKFLHDFFIVQLDDALYLDCDAARLDELKRRLTIYRLRSKVTLEAAEDRFLVAAIFGEGALAAVGLPDELGSARSFAGGVAYVDPRLSAMGARAVLPAAAVSEVRTRAEFSQGEFASYERLRLYHGVPSGNGDLAVEKATLLESNFEELNGLDWDKGCYVGQEVTARMKYRGLVRKRLMPVDIEGPIPEPDTPVMFGEKEAGTMRTGAAGKGIALLRLDLVEEAKHAGAPMIAGGAQLTPRKPDWATF